MILACSSDVTYVRKHYIHVHVFHNSNKEIAAPWHIQLKTSREGDLVLMTYHTGVVN